MFAFTWVDSSTRWRVFGTFRIAMWSEVNLNRSISSAWEPDCSKKIDGMLLSWENDQVCVFGCYFSCTEAKKEDMDLRLIGQAMERSADSRQRRWAQRCPCRGRKPNLGCHWMDCELAPPSFLLRHGFVQTLAIYPQNPPAWQFSPANDMMKQQWIWCTTYFRTNSHHVFGIPFYPTISPSWLVWILGFILFYDLILLLSPIYDIYFWWNHTVNPYKCPILWETMGNLQIFQGSQAEHGEIPPLHPLRWWRAPRAAELGGRNQSDLWALSVQPASDLSQAGIGM